MVAISSYYDYGVFVTHVAGQAYPGVLPGQDRVESGGVETFCLVDKTLQVGGVDHGQEHLPGGHAGRGNRHVQVSQN